MVVLKYPAMRLKLLVLLTLCLLIAAVPFAARAQESGDLLARVNNLRAQNGVPPYSLNGALSAAAQQQAQWIVDTGNVAHTHPDGSGPRTRALANGYPSIDVGENIYGGTNADVNDAWTFWVNSGIHFQGMVNPRHQEIGIGVAHGGWGSAYVLVFGGNGAPPPVSAGGSGNNGGGNAAAAAGPPAYVGGLDENGNIKHIVQPGDTLGDIALIYGYTWSDLPYMMQLNGMSNVRDLEVGSIFLVPPKGGTLTPTPDNRPPTETPVPTAIPPSITPFVMVTNTPMTSDTIPTPDIVTTAIATPIATAGGNVAPPDDTGGTLVAALPTPETVIASSGMPRMSSETWIMIALGVQVVIVVGAGIEFLRRVVKRRRR
jgi:hypothetical protein